MPTVAALLSLSGALAGLVVLFAWLWARARSGQAKAQVEAVVQRRRAETLMEVMATEKASKARLLSDLARIEEERRKWDESEKAIQPRRPGDRIDFGGRPPATGV